MPPFDSRIDDLYKGPLEEFVSRRTALAKTLTGDDARQVKALQKPTVVPWSVNQVFWHARTVYDRLAASGEKLRGAQIAALKGAASDVRRATDAHRKAMADAVAEALRLASAAGARPNADEVAKMLEAISVASHLPEQPGRLTKTLRPAGFEALAGIPVKAVRREASAGRTPVPVASPLEPAVRPRGALKLAEHARAAERKREAEVRRKKKAMERATASVDRARAAEALARAAWERAKRALADAELTSSTLQDR